jgi:protein TonB
VVNGGGTKKREVKPKFPEVLRAQGIEADVVLRVTFDPTGKVTKVDVVTPAAQKEFNDAAVAAAFQEEYVPATRNGVAISKTIQFTTKFRLED